MPDELGGIIHGYEIEDRPGARLCIGIPPGRQRPALWIEEGGQVVVLAQFHGEKHALVTVNFLDTLIGQIGRVIKFLADKHGDETG